MIRSREVSDCLEGGEMQAYADVYTDLQGDAFRYQLLSACRCHVYVGSLLTTSLSGYVWLDYPDLGTLLTVASIIADGR